MAEVVSVNEKNFADEIEKSKVPVVLDFSATWCGPCQMLKPIFEEMSSKYKDKIKFGAIDIDQSQSVAVKFGIMSVPTMIFFKDGKEVDRTIGLIPKNKLAEKIDKLFSK